MTTSNIEPFKANWLLAAFSDENLERLFPHIKPILFHDEQVLFEDHVLHDTLYFPKRGLLSLVFASKKKVDVEVGIVGQEGAANLISVLSCRSTIGLCNVQIAGNGWRMEGATFRGEFAVNGAFRDRVLTYLHYWNVQASQSIVCNRLHSIEQRLSRWLLMCQDQTGNQVLEITHEFLANMLGTGRVGVTLVAKELRDAGLIDYGRRNVVITDRPGLEARACECYAATRRRLEEIHGPTSEIKEMEMAPPAAR